MFMRSEKINVQEGINVQAGKYFKINKRTGPNKVRTGGKFDSKIINVPVRLLKTREYNFCCIAPYEKKFIYKERLLYKFFICQKRFLQKSKVSKKIVMKEFCS